MTTKPKEIVFVDYANTRFNSFMYSVLAFLPKHIPDVVLESFYKQGFVDALDMLKDHDDSILRSAIDPTAATK